MSEPTPPQTNMPEPAYPEPIPDTPNNIARAILTTPPKPPDEWRYLQDTAD